MKVFIYDNGLNLVNYVNAVKRAGARVILSKNTALSRHADALVLSGGKNVNPHLYGVNAKRLVNVDTATDVAELHLIESFLNARKKIIGVCKGLQILNVYFGGTLKFISGHTQNGKNDSFHDIKTVKNTFLRDIYGEKKCVNSAHVMAIDKLSPALSVSATSADGVIEGVYNKKLNVYAVQFHPERLVRPARDRFYDYVLNN